MDKDKKTKILLLTIGILLIIISVIITRLKYFRIVINILGIILILIFTIYKDTSKCKLLPLFIFLFLIGSMLIDSIVAISFNRLPIFSYSSSVYGKSKTYNAIGYRVWDCEGKELKIDRMYKMGYYCDVSKMEAMEVNSFLNQVVDNFDDYKNNYIKINGKISKKEGLNYIEMQSYQSNSITLNGYVTFSDNITLRVVFNSANKELSNYDVYDNITVVGKIWYLKEENGKYTIYMEDSKITSHESRDEYEIILSKTNDCNGDKKLLYAGADYNLYSYCLDSVIVKYDENSIYEISSVLSSGKIKVDDLIKDSKNEEINKEDNSILYTFDNYNIIKCSEYSGSDVIIGDTNLTLYDIHCAIPIEWLR